MMKKRIFLAMSAVVMLAMGVCGCSNDDDKIVLWDDSPQLVYEDNPTTIDGVWCLVHFSNGPGSLKDYNAGELALKIDEATKTMKVVNKLDGVFIPSGDYTYQLTGHKISTINDEEDGEAIYYTIEINPKDNPDAHYFTCGCNFCEGCLLFDDGMACDSPGYFFKKLKTVFELY